MAMANNSQITHVLFIIHVPHQILSTSFGFNGDEWISAHIEVLCPSANDVLVKRPKASIREIFIGQSSELCHNNQPLSHRMFKYIQAAVSRLNDCTTERSAKRVELLMELIPENVDDVLGKSVLVLCVLDIMVSLKLSCRIILLHS